MKQNSEIEEVLREIRSRLNIPEEEKRECFIKAKEYIAAYRKKSEKGFEIDSLKKTGVCLFRIRYDLAKKIYFEIIPKYGITSIEEAVSRGCNRQDDLSIEFQTQHDFVGLFVELWMDEYFDEQFFHRIKKIYPGYPVWEERISSQEYFDATDYLSTEISWAFTDFWRADSKETHIQCKEKLRKRIVNVYVKFLELVKDSKENQYDYEEILSWVEKEIERELENLDKS